ncbi:tetratricopeptide repeat protein [Azoarcus sp. DN11]|uniref:LytR C-terminal domain-containing protein n=1 Tax=Azoarcus sp. DN11 TaxID=356837 RepID=UPI0025701812|nr:tetratricopeptide repeat protein [Azoarcus sp. DN11]
MLEPVLAALVLGACSTGPTMPERAWKIAPVQTVNHGGANATGYFALGRVKEGQGANRQAIAAYRKALDADPAYAAAWNALGALLVQEGQIAEGLAALERAVNLSPATSHLHNDLGYAQLLAGRDEAAASTLRRAVELDADNRRAWANLATAYRRTGANEQAEVASARARNAWAGAAILAKPAEAASARPAPQAALPHGATEPAPAPAGTGTPGVPTSMQQATPAVIAGNVMSTPQATLVKVAENVFELRNGPPHRAGTVAEAAAIIAASTRPVPANAPESGRAAAPAAPFVIPAASMAPAMPTPPSRPVRLEITNGHGGEGLARRLASLLGQRGVARPRLTNLPPFTQPGSYIEYREGFRDAAEAFAAKLPFRPAIHPGAAGRLLADVRLVLGHDLTTSDACAVLRVCTHVARSAPVRIEPARVVAASIQRPSGD